jgi:hypothetical protein
MTRLLQILNLKWINYYIIKRMHKTYLANFCIYVFFLCKYDLKCIKEITNYIKYEYVMLIF